MIKCYTIENMLKYLINFLKKMGIYLYKVQVYQNVDKDSGVNSSTLAVGDKMEPCEV